MREGGLTGTVLDFDGLRVGEVRDVLVHPRTGTPTQLIVGLSPEARLRLGGSFTLAIPFDRVRALRRGELALDRSLRELAAHRMPAPRMPAHVPGHAGRPPAT